MTAGLKSPTLDRAGCACSCHSDASAPRHGAQRSNASRVQRGGLDSSAVIPPPLKRMMLGLACLGVGPEDARAVRVVEGQ